jgi:hypothetical protein
VSKSQSRSAVAIARRIDGIAALRRKIEQASDDHARQILADELRSQQASLRAEGAAMCVCGWCVS